MTYNIWNRPEQDPNPDELILFKSKKYGLQFGKYEPIEKFCSRDEFVDPVGPDDIERWLYVEDIDKLQKALDRAKFLLMQIAYLNMSEHGIGSDSMMIDWCKTVACKALNEIDEIIKNEKDNQ